jgi:hypothetical protein
MLDRFLEIAIPKGPLGLLSCSENKNWKYLSLAHQRHSRCAVVSMSWEAYDPKLGGDLEEESSNGCILSEVL